MGCLTHRRGDGFCGISLCLRGMMRNGLRLRGVLWNSPCRWFCRGLGRNLWLVRRLNYGGVGRGFCRTFHGCGRRGFRLVHF